MKSQQKRVHGSHKPGAVLLGIPFSFSILCSSLLDEVQVLCVVRPLSEKKGAFNETPPTLGPESQHTVPGTFSKWSSYGSRCS